LLADRAKFAIIVGTIFEVPVNLPIRHVRRHNPLFITWVDVCVAKDSGHTAGGEVG